MMPSLPIRGRETCRRIFSRLRESCSSTTISEGRVCLDPGPRFAEARLIAVYFSEDLIDGEEIQREKIKRHDEEETGAEGEIEAVGGKEKIAGDGIIAHGRATDRPLARISGRRSAALQHQTFGVR